MKKKKQINSEKSVNTFKLLYSVMTKKQIIEFVFLMLLGIIAAAAVLVPTQIISIIISKLSGETIYIFGIAISNDISYITIIVVGATITFLMRTVNMLYDLLIEKLIKRVLANLRSESYRWLVTPRKNMDLKMTQGDAVYRINQAPDLVSTTLCDLFENIMPEILSAFIAFAYILILDWTTLPVIIIGVFIVFICVIVRTKVEKNISYRTEKAKSSMSSTASNTITNLPLITLYKSMTHESAIYDAKVDKFYNEQKKQINLRIVYWTLVRLAQVLTTFIVIYLCAEKIYLGTMLVGNIVIISNYVAQIFSPIQTIGYFTANWVQSSVAINRMYKLKPEFKDLLKTNNNVNETIESIELTHICAKNSDNFSIENINAKFEKGKLTVVSGESGSGKSTLIKLLCGLAEKTSGEIVINNKKKLASGYSVVDKTSVAMQDAYIFNRDIELNVLYPDGNGDKDRYEPIVEELSLGKVLNRKYNEEDERNLDTMLSGGEKKRIGLSRALIKQADIYIFDEPTNDLDNHNAEKVIKAIQNLKDEAIVIIVSHDDRVKNIADQMLVFAERGKLTKVK